MTELIESVVRFSRGLFDGATDDDKRAFAAFRVRANKARTQWKRETLSEYFADDFAGFTAEYFKIIDADVRRELRDLLRDRGVYVPKGRGVLIFDGLYAVVKDDLPWPEKEKEEQSTTQVATTEAVAEEPQERETFVTITQVERRGSMANLFKAYSNDEDRYLGSMKDNFGRKFRLFIERCDQAVIPENDRHCAFSIMLAGNARQFFFDYLSPKNLDLMALATAIKERF